MKQFCYIIYVYILTLNIIAFPEFPLILLQWDSSIHTQTLTKHSDIFLALDLNLTLSNLLTHPFSSMFLFNFMCSFLFIAHLAILTIFIIFQFLNTQIVTSFFHMIKLSTNPNQNPILNIQYENIKSYGLVITPEWLIESKMLLGMIWHCSLVFP